MSEDPFRPAEAPEPTAVQRDASGHRVPIARGLWDRAALATKGIEVPFASHTEAEKIRQLLYNYRRKERKRRGGTTLWDDLSVAVLGPPTRERFTIMIYREANLESLLLYPVQEIP